MKKIIISLACCLIISLSCSKENEICNCNKYERIIYEGSKRQPRYSIPYPIQCEEPYEWQQEKEEVIQGTKMTYEYRVECE